MPDQLGSRFPGYDVLSKRAGPSWNDKTRDVIAERLRIEDQPKFFVANEFATVRAIADRIVPQPQPRSRIPVASLVDDKLYRAQSDGYRPPDTPRDGDAWRLGLKALDAEAEAAFGARFEKLAAGEQDLLLARMHRGELRSAAWGGMASDVFFKMRLARDLVLAYYAHPTAWSEIGWGGPASPRGYVRMDFDERDPWEAAEAKAGHIETARRENHRVR